MRLIQIIQWLFVIAAVLSASRISAIARNETGKSQWLASFTDIFDYVEITWRKEGRIEIWFWIFIVSFSSMMALILLK